MNNKNALIENNEISYNGISSMGSPTSEHNPNVVYNTDNSIVRNNWIHHNIFGIWNEVASFCVYERNLIEYNQRTGIFVDSSKNTVIRKNIIQYNGVK